MLSTTKQFFIVILGLLLLNVLSAFVYTRFDLTADKRYTLSGATQQLLENLPARVHIDVYLTGGLPSGFKRLEVATRETIEEFKVSAGGTLSFRFIDPLAGTLAVQAQLQARLTKLGIQPTNLFARQGATRTEQLIFPGAVVRVKGKETGVLLLRGNKASSPAEQLNQSYEGVEYQLAAAIRKLIQPEGSRRRVGLVYGHTKVPPERFSDLLASIQQQYDLFFVDLKKPGPIEGVNALMVLKPDQPFTESEVFKLDQYVVGGGSALFMVDGHRIDSVSAEGSYAQPMPLGLDDLFFTWGTRLNRTVLKDLSCGVIPLNVGVVGDKPNVQLLPWRFYPVINSFGDSPITRNLDALNGRFMSTLDTVRVRDIRKTALLKTSPYTSVLNVPALIAYNEARQQPDPATYAAGVQLTGLLLEGKFVSRFANFLLPDSLAKGFKNKGLAGKVVICSDGDLAVNDVDYKQKMPLPLGYDRYSRTQFANKEFILNTLDYLADPSGLILARSREVPVRPLDAVKTGQQRTWWQLLNVLGPIGLLLSAGLAGQWIRRRRYGG